MPAELPETLQGTSMLRTVRCVKSGRRDGRTEALRPASCLQLRCLRLQHACGSQGVTLPGGRPALLQEIS